MAENNFSLLITTNWILLVVDFVIWLEVKVVNILDFLHQYDIL